MIKYIQIIGRFEIVRKTNPYLFPPTGSCHFVPEEQYEQEYFFSVGVAESDCLPTMSDYLFTLSVCSQVLN